VSRRSLTPAAALRAPTRFCFFFLDGSAVSRPPPCGRFKTSSPTHPRPHLNLNNFVCIHPFATKFAGQPAFNKGSVDFKNRTLPRNRFFPLSSPATGQGGRERGAVLRSRRARIRQWLEAATTPGSPFLRRSRRSARSTGAFFFRVCFSPAGF
jgi:hypothetical protein